MEKQLIAWTGGRQIMVVVGLLLAGVLAGVFATAGIFLGFFDVKLREDKVREEVRQDKVLPKIQPPVRVAIAALHAGASAEEVERLVTVPLEINLAGMPGLKATYSRSQDGLARLDCEFEAGLNPMDARQEVINRLSMPVQPLPPGVAAHLVASSTFAEPALRYTLSNPSNVLGTPVYTLNDLRALQDWLLERQWRGIAGVFDIGSFGGTVKRYEIHPDPERMKRYGISLTAVSAALTNSNMNVGGDFLQKEPGFKGILARGLIGGQKDPMEHALTLNSPKKAADYLRAEERRRCNEIRGIVIASINDRPIKIDDVVEGGPLPYPDALSSQGVIVGHQTRQGAVSVSRLRKDARGAPLHDAAGKLQWIIEPDAIQGIVLMRKDPQAARGIANMPAKINEGPGKLLPGVKLVTYPGPETGFFIHGLFPSSLLLDQVAEGALRAHAILREFVEVEAVLSETGRADGVDGVGLPNQVELFVPLKSPAAWPAPPGRDRPRSWEELLRDVQAELTRQIPGASWYCSRYPGQGSMEPFAPNPDECLVKILGPDLAELDRLAERMKQKLAGVQGVGDNVRLFPIMGQSRIEFTIDKKKCERFGLQVNDVANVINMLVHGYPATSMVEGEKTFDITLRLPGPRGRAAILETRVGLWNRMLTPNSIPAPGQTGIVGPSMGPASPAGTINPQPTAMGLYLAPQNDFTPGLRLKDLVSPVDGDGRAAPDGDFVRPGPACIYRHNGKRLVSLKFRAGERAPADALAAAQAAAAGLVVGPYRAEWLAP